MNIMNKIPIVLLRGGGDLASGVALPLQPDELPMAGARVSGDTRFYLDDYHPEVLFRY